MLSCPWDQLTCTHTREGACWEEVRDVLEQLKLFSNNIILKIPNFFQMWSYKIQYTSLLFLNIVITKAFLMGVGTWWSSVSYV